MARKIGFSLSFCVRDIVEGRVKIEDVHHIVTGCSPEREGHVDEILVAYSDCYWRNNPDASRAVFRQLRDEGKIMWCSTFDKSPVNIGSFHWVDCPE